MDNLGVSEKERYVFTIQKQSQKIILANTVRDSLDYQKQTGENPEIVDEDSFSPTDGDGVYNQLMIVKNFSSVSETLMELAKKYEQQCEGQEEILISAYRILPNNYDEKPIYGKFTNFWEVDLYLWI